MLVWPLNSRQLIVEFEPLLLLLAVRPSLDVEWSTTELIKGGSFRFNYHLMLEYRNSKVHAVFKALLASAGFRVCLERDMPYSITIWLVLVELNERIFR